MSNLDNVNWCGTSEIVIFVLTVFFGTAYAVSCKVLLSLNGTDEEDGSTHIESFHKPLFEAFGMLVGMTLALLLHWAVMIFKIDFPGYDFDKQEKVHTTNDEVDYNYRTNGAEHPEQAPKPKSYILTSKTTSRRIYFVLAIPAIFELLATVMFMIGLQYLDVSFHQTLRGSQIIFVALLKQYVSKTQLLTFHWIGVSWNVVSVVLVGATALLVSDENEDGSKDVSTTQVISGVCLSLTLSGAFTQALETTSIEYVMKMDDYVPPLLLVGMLGMWIGL